MNGGTFAGQYRWLLNLLLHDDTSTEELNGRTGHRVRVMEPCSVALDLSRTLSLPLPDCRRVHPRTAAAETAWFIRGERTTPWLDRYAKIWRKFVEADGETVAAAYGYRWRRHFGRDQLGDAIDALRRDRSDRRCFVSAWDPGADGLGRQGQKNVPCPVGFTLSVTANRLNSTLLIRSSDVFVGLPYDVMGHAMLMTCVSASVGGHGDVVLPGHMQVSVAHPHLYDSHFAMAREALAQPRTEPYVPLLGWSVGQVEQAPEQFVESYTASSSETRWPEFNPRPEVVQ